MSFTINPLLYLIMIGIEIFLTFELCHSLTKLRFNKSRKYIGMAVIILAVFLLDVFVFNMSKTTVRIIMVMGIYFIGFKYVSHATWVQSLLQIFILFATLIIVDIITVVILNLFVNNLSEAFAHFEIAYGIYLAIVGVAVVVLRRFEIKVFRLERLKI